MIAKCIVLLAAACLFFYLPAMAQVQRVQPTTYDPSALESHAARIEHDATADLKTDPKGYGWFVDMDAFLPSDSAEYQALGKYVILVFAVFSDDRTELPLTAVYSGGVPINCLEPVWRDVPPDSNTARAYGKFRSDMLCLLPVDLALKNSSISVDFTKNRKAMEVSSYSFATADVVKADKDPKAAPQPNPAVLGKIIACEYPGFGFQVSP